LQDYLLDGPSRVDSELHLLGNAHFLIEIGSNIICHEDEAPGLGHGHVWHVELRVVSYRLQDRTRILIHYDIGLLCGHVNEVIVPEQMYGSICDRIALFVFFKLYDSLSDSHIVEVHKFVLSNDT
jgi:hypothetical protein